MEPLPVPLPVLLPLPVPLPVVEPEPVPDLLLEPVPDVLEPEPEPEPDPEVPRFRVPPLPDPVPEPEPVAPEPLVLLPVVPEAPAPEVVPESLAFPERLLLRFRRLPVVPVPVEPFERSSVVTPAPAPVEVDPEPEVEEPDCWEPPLFDRSVPLVVPLCANAHGSEIAAANVVIRNFFMENALSFRAVLQRLLTKGDHFSNNGDPPYIQRHQRNVQSGSPITMFCQLRAGIAM
ncbi:MAG TPA: hypothetical protein VER03_21475 [Bryobacteraceae bacterium]|nr:hypothetical protein [Bryobacteraceae bacterium]